MTTNSKDSDKNFQYAIAAAEKHENIGKLPERVTKIRPFINQYKYRGQVTKYVIVIKIKNLRRLHFLFMQIQNLHLRKYIQSRRVFYNKNK